MFKYQSFKNVQNNQTGCQFGKGYGRIPNVMVISSVLILESIPFFQIISSLHIWILFIHVIIYIKPVKAEAVLKTMPAQFWYKWTSQICIKDSFSWVTYEDWRPLVGNSGFQKCFINNFLFSECVNFFYLICFVFSGLLK